MLRAIIVDDEILSVNRLQRLLSESDELEICDAFLSPLEAYEYVKLNPIHIAFLDISMPEIDGMRLSSLLLEIDPLIDIIFVTAHDNYAVRAFDLSAMDYLLKPVTVQRLSKTLEKIRRRQMFQAAQSSIQLPISLSKSNHALLTEQEMRILRLIAAGLSNKEIVPRLKITNETVKFHIKNIYKKLGAHNRVRALQRARELRLLV